MQLNEIIFQNAVPIDSYGPGFFRIAEDVIYGPILIAEGQVHTWDGYQDHQALLNLAGRVDVLFIGTGAETRHIPADLREALEEKNIGVEAMNSPAVCRTYNVLLSEGRRVAAAILPV